MAATCGYILNASALQPNLSRPITAHSAVPASSSFRLIVNCSPPSLWPLIFYSVQIKLIQSGKLINFLDIRLQEPGLYFAVYLKMLSQAFLYFSIYCLAHESSLTLRHSYTFSDHLGVCCRLCQDVTYFVAYLCHLSTAELTGTVVSFLSAPQIQL